MANEKEEVVVGENVQQRPKNRKQLRLEKKAAAKKKKKEEIIVAAEGNNKADRDILEKSEYRKLKKMQQKEEMKQEQKNLQKEIREEKKIRKRKRLNREINAPKGGGKVDCNNKSSASASSVGTTVDRTKTKKRKNHKNDDDNQEERDISMHVFTSVFTAKNSGEGGLRSGLMTTRLGVQYQDVVVGNGNVVHDGNSITVKYELTGGKFGAILDSSNNFTFRLGLSEVIQGWDIGLEGIRIGGRRKIIVPPKAGYGGKDIGGGPGATLYFDVTVVK